MALNRIQLRKLLKILFLDPNARRGEIRADIRDEISHETGTSSSGPDFYGPFWSDAKRHVFGVADLHALVEDRIEANDRRANLYPQLRDGFLAWWNVRRRWTNEPFMPGPSVSGTVDFPDLNATVKVDNVLCVIDGTGERHVIYPYFSPSPELSAESARLGIWLLSIALPNVPFEEIRILDMIRGITFSVDRYPLQGNEETEFVRRYAAALDERAILRREYP
ncbi:hypothetical protein [Sphingomonas sp. VNH70]|uniref:hypothetical protein n=1 Tax=Sphingomonas silueang TaxID=3156617 RepID=UPI0032B535A4